MKIAAARSSCSPLAGILARRPVRWLLSAVAAALSALLFGYLVLGLVTPPPLLENIPFGRVALDAEGGLLRLRLAEDGRYRLRVGLDAVAPEAVRALLHYEDRYFYLHPGVNPCALIRAAAQTLFGGSRRMGASTISMQVARLRLGLRTASLEGKLRQIWAALLLERHYTKQELLEAYFNLAPYGGNIEGIEAAARIYFGKTAARLSDLECHALAVVPQNPVRRDPARGGEFRQARARLERELSGLGPEAPVPPLRVRSPARLPFGAPHLVTELLGDGPEAVEGGTVRTCIAPGLQRLLEEALAVHAGRLRRYGITNAAAILVHAPTMQVRALAGSAEFFSAAVSGQVDGTRARRSPGSTLKPFIYALALEEGLIHPLTLLNDSPRSFGGYDPENFDRGFRGPLPAREALRASRNLPAITLAEQLRSPGLYGFLRKAGVRLAQGPEHYGLALVLGGAEVSLRELAALYAMLANQGLWQPLRLTLDERREAPRRLLSPEAAHVTLRMLEREDLALSGAGGAVLPVRCKTGTSNGFRDAWTAGVFGEYALVVWVGNFDNSASPRLVGAETALPLFMEIGRGVAGRQPLRDRVRDAERNLNVITLQVCAATGDLDVSRCADTAETLFIPGVSPTRDSGVLRPILIDTATGLRACDASSGGTTTVYWEFWSTEQRRIFAQAGISKPLPPEWLPECRAADRRGNGGKPPRILLPKKKVTYHHAGGASGRGIPLQASTEADVKRVHWFAGSVHLGVSAPDEILFWHPPAGKSVVELVAVDDKGRSARQICRIEPLP